MQKEESIPTNETNYDQPLKIEKDNIICKDGFCVISNNDESRKVNQNDLNLFDPI
mgnify:CR=1 FL=1